MAIHDWETPSSSSVRAEFPVQLRRRKSIGRKSHHSLDLSPWALETLRLAPSDSEHGDEQDLELVLGHILTEISRGQ